MNTESPLSAPPARFPYARFFLIVLAQLGVAFGIFRLVAPNQWAIEWSHPWSIVLWVMILTLPMSLFEYLYHRYLLHSAVLPFLASMQRAHVTHHKLTYVKAAVTAVEPDKMAPVSSRYPILVEEQEEAMMFPLYSISIFMALFVVVLGIPFKLLFPTQPVFTAMLFAITIQYMGYELWHMVIHLPYEKVWMPLLDNRFTSKMTRWVYGFHLMHHWRQNCNLAVVGYWGIAIWDHLFRTHLRPERLPIDGSKVNYWDGKVRQPLFPINLLDKLQSRLTKRSRRIEAFASRLFVRRSSSEMGS